MQTNHIAGTKAQYERKWARSSKIKSILALTHPTAVLVFSFTTFVLAVMADGKLPDGYSLFCLVVAMASAQCAIGLFNEVFDRDLDRVAKPWRAIPAGHISAGAASIIGLGAVLLGLVLASRVSLLSMILLGIGIATGILYSAALKRSILSWVPYLAAYPSLPIWVWISLDKFDLEMLAVYLVAFPIVLAIHLTNQLRDFDEDAAMQVNGLVQHVGKSNSIKLCFILLLISPVPVLVWVPLRPGIWSVSIGLGAAVAHWLLVARLVSKGSRGSSPETFRTLFRRLQLTGPLMLFSWLLIWQL